MVIAGKFPRGGGDTGQSTTYIVLLVNENWVMEVKCVSVISGDRHLVSSGPEIDLSLITQLGLFAQSRNNRCDIANVNNST